MYELQAYILLAGVVILVFGGLVAFYSVRAARRTRDRALWVLAVGISLITVGALTSGVVSHLASLDTEPWIVVTSTVLATGFIALAYSLYAGRTILE